jgi:hypothetical protein
LFRKPGHALAVNEALPSFEHNSIVAWRACTIPKPRPIAGRGSVGSDLKQACSKPTSRFGPNNLIRRARAYRTVASASTGARFSSRSRADILSEVCVARETVRGFLSPKAQWTTASRKKCTSNGPVNVDSGRPRRASGAAVCWNTFDGVRRRIDVRAGPRGEGVSIGPRDA